MKRLLAILLAVLTAGVAKADEFSDFRIPTHTLYSVRGEASGGWWGYRTRYLSSGYRYSRLEGRARGDGEWVYDSDRLQGAVSVDGSAYGWSGSRRHNDTQMLDSLGSQSYDDKEDLDYVSESWNVSAGGRLYPWAMPVGVQGRVGGRGGYGQQWRTSTVHSEYTSHTQTDDNVSEWWTYSHSAYGSVSLGYGRVRDATPVFHVRTLEDRLLETGALKRHLSKEARERLAALIFAGAEYGTVHDYGVKFFWQELERILREDGALRDGGLDAYDVMRAMQPYTGQVYMPWSEPRSELRPSYLYGSYVPTGFRRSCGYFIGLAVYGEHRHYVSRSDSRTHHTEADSGVVVEDTLTSSHQRWTGSYDLVSIGPSAEYHRPLGMRWQFDMSASLLLPTDDAAHAIDLHSLLDIRYLVTERWSAVLSLVHDRVVLERQTARSGSDYWSVGIGGSVSYYIEDRLSVSLAASHSQQRSNAVDWTSGGSAYDRYESVTLGLSYHFLGGLTIPGVASPSKLPPMQFKP